MARRRVVLARHCRGIASALRRGQEMYSAARTREGCGEPEFERPRKVLDPIRVPGRGALKKRMNAMKEKKRSIVKCGRKGEGYNWRRCSKMEEVENMSNNTMLHANDSLNLCLCR
ncbi:hypothetical protein BS78_03G404100 [Paspalum vaginatum]|nr:hypothetical protein BS78_03G404100 [Paspalum vaginatum]